MLLAELAGVDPSEITRDIVFHGKVRRHYHSGTNYDGAKSVDLITVVEFTYACTIRD